MPPKKKPNELEEIVQKMMDANESQANIEAVIEEYDRQNPVELAKAPLPTPIGPNEPSDFTGGVMKSVFGGEALKTGLQGGLGFLKGATIDLPSSIVGGIKTVGNLISDPAGTIGSIPEALEGMAETTMRAGAEPEAFGRMMGQVTGQPLVTAGLVRGAPPAFRATGAPIEGIGRIMKEYQPVSGMMPNMLDMRTLRNIERFAGGQVENIGRRMRGPVQGEVPLGRTPASNIIEGEIVPEAAVEPPLQLPASSTTRYAGPGNITNQLRAATEIEAPSPTAGQHMAPSPVTEVSKAPPALTIENAPVGQNLKLRQQYATPDKVKELRARGFEFQGIAEDGGMKFRKMQ